MYMYTGYANEVGEAFRSLTPVTFVRATYGVASVYVLADTYDKASKMNKVKLIIVPYITCILLL